MLVWLSVHCFVIDPPEENAWPVVDEVKDAAKFGESAGCAAGSDIGRNDANCPAAVS